MGKSASSKPSSPAEGPMVFHLGKEGDEAHPRLIEEPDFTQAKTAEREVAPKQSGGWMRGLFWGALTALISLFIVDSIWRLVDSLAARSPILGQVALIIAILCALAALFFIMRDIFALRRLNRVAHLRQEAAIIIAHPQPKSVDAYAQRLLAFYAQDPASAAGRARCEAMLSDVHDPHTLLATLERALLEAKDGEARTLIAQAAQRVSIVTAISPRALVDILFVLAQSFTLIRAISMVYGGRASGFGLLRLISRVATHLAITGGMAIADSALSEIVGGSMAARLSTKLGEGIVNGILTARIGIATIELTRPMPFAECDPIILSQVVKSLVFSKKVAENTAD